MKPFLPGRLEHENYPEMEVWKIILAWQYTWICFVGVIFFSDSTMVNHHFSPPFPIGSMYGIFIYILW